MASSVREVNESGSRPSRSIILTIFIAELIPTKDEKKRLMMNIYGYIDDDDQRKHAHVSYVSLSQHAWVVYIYIYI